MWIRAILWEYNENFQDHRVKGLLMRAQQRHPESQKLYYTFFQIELENKRKADESMVIQHADIVYSNGKKKFNEIEFFIEMLSIVDKFPYAKGIQQTILDDMRRLFPRHELLWHTLAQRELNGQSPTDDTIDIADAVKKEDEDSQNGHIDLSSASAAHTLKKRIELCVQIYDSAVKLVDTVAMWNFYINAMLEMNSDLTTQASLKRQALNRAFRAANESNNMSENHYLQYVELLYANNPKDETIAQVLEKATTKFNQTLKVWMQCMRYYIQENNFKKTQEVFQKAKHHLGPNGQELWQLYLIYLKTLQSAEAIQEFESLVQEVSRQTHPAFNVFKAKIIELIATTVNIKKARKTYQMFTKNCPGSYEVHEMMADLESKQVICRAVDGFPSRPSLLIALFRQMKRDVKAERNCLEMMIMSFGKVKTEVWLRYMRVELSAGEAKNIGKLYERAMAMLNPELLEDFVSLHSLFISGVV